MKKLLYALLLFPLLALAGGTSNLLLGFGGSSDPFFANVSALLHMDGVDNGTVFTDQKGATWTRSGSGVTDTAQFKFGTASYNSPSGASDNRVSTPSDTKFGYGTGDLTIEFFIRFNASGTQVFYDQRTLSTEAVVPTIYLSAGEFFYYVDGANRINTGTFGFTTDVWYHLAVSKVSGTTRLFVDGTQLGGNYADSHNYIDSNVTLGVTAHSPGAGFNLDGWIDELRITKGVGRYSANFTPPTAAFPNQ